MLMKIVSVGKQMTVILYLSLYGSGSLGNALAPTAKPLAGSTNSLLSSPGTASKLNVSSLNKAAARLKKINKKMI